jgi:hypothetical protein
VNTIFRYYCTMHDKIDRTPRACLDGYRQMANDRPVTCEMVPVKIESVR